MTQIIAGLQDNGLPEGVSFDRPVQYSGYYGHDVIRDGWPLGRVLVWPNGAVAVDSTGVHSDHPSKSAAALAVVRRWEDREAILARTGRSQIIDSLR